LRGEGLASAKLFKKRAELIVTRKNQERWPVMSKSPFLQSCLTSCVAVITATAQSNLIVIGSSISHCSVWCNFATQYTC